MVNLLTDANVHFHFEWEAPEDNLLKELPKIQYLKGKYEQKGFKVKNFFVTTLPYLKLLRILSKNTDLILGLYLPFPNDATLDPGLLTYFKYVKIRPYFDIAYFHLDKLKKFFDELSNTNINPIQLHVETLPLDLVKFLKDTLPSCRFNLQLVHGVYALYRQVPYEISNQELQKIVRSIVDIDGVFLGTSNFEHYSEDPHPYLKRALDDNLGDQIVYESDFILGYPYSLEVALGNFEGCRNAIGYDSRVYFKNAERLSKNR
ncbi:MAG: hypothetical protein QXQ18_02985 [Candidatus Aenigmatarchaeota archaeon]